MTERSASCSHGNHAPFIGARVSYTFDLRGPGAMVCTGCSSSLLAVHMAMKALCANECDMALAGGIHLDLAPYRCQDDIWSQLGITGANMKCKVFSNDANGMYERLEARAKRQSKAERTAHLSFC
jgi:acyl transferase domain-containing protein